MLKYKLLFIIILTTSIVSGQTWNLVSKKIDQKDEFRVNKGILFGTNLLDYSGNIPYWNGANFGSAVTVPYANITFAAGEKPVAYFDVKTYGATGDGVTDDLTAIRAAITAASALVNPIAGTGGAVVYFPHGKYYVSDSIVFSTMLVSLWGTGDGSVIYSTGNHATIRFRNCARFSVKDIAVLGNGGANGAGATNGNGIELWNSHYSNFTNVTVKYNGGYAFYALNGMWGNRFDHCTIQHNAGDAFNTVNNSAQFNTGSNGNGISITNSSISSNGGDGIEWSAASINITGNTIENNLGAGIMIGSTASTSGCYNANITGNYFEGNVLGQILLQTQQTPAKQIEGFNITGNYLRSELGSGATALIVGDVSGTYAGSLRNGVIGPNYYYKAGGYVVWDVYLEASRNDVTIITNNDPASIYIGSVGTTSATIVAAGQPTPVLTYNASITAAGGITLAMLVPNIYVALSADVDITANPQIVAGYDGQEITITNQSAAYKLILDNGTGLKLNNNAQCRLRRGEFIRLKYIAELSTWYEVYRSKDLSGTTVISKTLGIYGVAGCDFNFTNPGNTTQQNIDLGAIIPAKARITAIEMVCTVSLTGGTITLAAGNASAGTQFIIATACSTANTVVGIIDATKPAAVVMNWTTITDIFIGGVPSANWSTLSTGKWTIYITYENYADNL